MTGKKKLWLALSMFALVVVVAAASVGITLAALSGDVKSTFNISYTASNVEATVQAKYSTNSGESYNGLKYEEGDQIDFTTGTENNDNQKSFQGVTTTFASAESKIYVAFKFTNNSTTNHGLKVTAKWEAGRDNKNVDIKYAWSESDTYGKSQSDAGTKPEEFQAISGLQADAKTIPASTGNTYVLWLEVSITKNIEDATFAGDISFNLVNA